MYINFSNWQHKILISFPIATLVLIFARLPEVAYLPSANPQPGLFDKLKGLYILLPDDVMVTMRVAKFFLISGYPGFNYSDVAQPATSFLLPIIGSVFFFLFPDNIALATVSLLGASFIVLIGYVIATTAGGRVGFGLACIWFLNSTTLRYMFSGWEILWQSFFVLLAWALAWNLQANNNEGFYKYGLIAVISALAVLVRVDAVFLVLPLFLWLFLATRKKYALLSASVFVSLLLIYLYFQFIWFGLLTPTTARLKGEHLPGLDYSLSYLFKTFKAGSSTAFIALLVPFLFLRPFLAAKNPTFWAGTAILASSAYAFIVSDVFASGRMFLSSLALLLYVVAKNQHEIRLSCDRKLLVFISALAMFFLSLSLGMPAVEKLSNLITRPMSPPVPIGAIPEQVVLSQYIRSTFSKSDGPIGLFYLGTISFYMMDYEITDFLGKADESIARIQPKWGPPGHNKWDTQISLAKWNPAVIPFPSSLALQPLSVRKEALTKKANYAFWQDYSIELEKQGYVFCKPYINLDFGLYVRSDLTKKVPSCAIGSISPAFQSGHS
ncbi:MAG TPA: hypothetical protein PKK23_13270 [Nitrospirales bacterium]|nr:hypothetical protein [Nitrospirales bacterium]